MKNVFNHFYADYDSWYDTAVGSFVDKTETDSLWKLLAPTAGMKVLDVGCGTGNHSLKLAALGCRVTGIDIAPNMLEQAVKKAGRAAYGGNANFQIMNCMDMTFPNDSFDAAVSMAAFEFISDIHTAYREMYRVVKPGGRIVIGTIQKGGAWYDLYVSAACEGTAYEFARFLSGSEISALDTGHLYAREECLFIPPGQPDETYTLENEEARAALGGKGGFVCVRFRK